MSLWTSWVSTLICKSREYINLSPRIDIIHFLTHFCSFCFDRLADGSKQSQLFWQKLLDKMAQPTKKIDKNIFFYQPPENSVSPARACASLKMWRLFLAGWHRYLNQHECVLRWLLSIIRRCIGPMRRDTLPLILSVDN